MASVKKTPPKKVITPTMLPRIKGDLCLLGRHRPKVLRKSHANPAPAAAERPTKKGNVRIVRGKAVANKGASVEPSRPIRPISPGWIILFTNLNYLLRLP